MRPHRMLALFLSCAALAGCAAREEPLPEIAVARPEDRALPPPPPPEPEEGEEIEFDARLTLSEAETLRARDFEQMTAAEIAEAKRAIAALALPVSPIASRRTEANRRGRIADWRMTMRRAMRHGGEVRALEYRRRRIRWPALVALCDISGSMASYSRMLLHFLHAAANAHGANS
ncbi:MAG: hypothetical protein Tsb008_21130 [Rhodothalassiaceae bacterium]